MELNENTYERIQQYLDNSLNAQEREAFELDMKNDPALASEVALNRDMQDLLADTPENALRKNLQMLNAQVTENDDSAIYSSKNLLWFLPVLVLAGLGWWWWNTSPAPPAVSSFRIDLETSDTLESPSRVIIDTVENNIKKLDTTRIDETPSDQATPSTKPVEDKKPEKINPPKQIPDQKIQPIAANFQVNPSLEALIDNGIRSRDIVLDVEKRQDDVNLPSPTAAVKFNFAAVISSTENMSTKDFKLHVFSNNKKELDDFSPRFTKDLTLAETAADTYRIAVQENIVLSPGLYYYLLENADTEKIYLVEKFEVR